MPQSTQNETYTSHVAEATPPARILRLPDVMARAGLRRSAICQRMSDGRFPKSRSLGPKCAVWLESEVEDWIGTVTKLD
ncbi:AlpA family phage regulatory protein [Novosphingobium taihuense]|nr:AlpA family phage regulatory protein [Novosphingobium taihuense]